MKIVANRIFQSVSACIACAVILASCETFLGVASPASKIPGKLVFSDDAAANSAAIGMYISLSEQPSFAGGGTRSVMLLAGLSADELVNVPKKDRLYLDFEENNISALNDNILNLWGTIYKTIYSANAIVEGISYSEGVSATTKSQLEGEACFVRAFCYFYLVNLFGDVPLALTTDYNLNTSMKKSTVAEIYNQIVIDLTNAEELLGESYVGAERTRPNSFAATALLSRAYIYTKDWARAEDKATRVIENIGLYALSSLDKVFLSNSSEAIWQLRPLQLDPLTNEANLFNSTSGNSLNALNREILDRIEPEDHRFSEWMVESSEAGPLLLPLKYKRIRAGSALPKEYSMVIRLAEVYLIRAEARAKQNKLDGAILDLDQIRVRAGVRGIREIESDVTQENLITAIENERRIELVAEWGHRWLDLKRWGQASNILGPKKLDWQDTDVLYPIPESELSKNKMLKPQNMGY